jgi:hypothetical protein
MVGNVVGLDMSYGFTSDGEGEDRRLLYSLSISLLTSVSTRTQIFLPMSTLLLSGVRGLAPT